MEPKREYHRSDQPQVAPIKNDTYLRVSRVPEFLEEMSAVISRAHPTFEVVWVGHVGDGNFHMNILKPDDLPVDTLVQKCNSVDDVIFQMIEKLEWSTSAEHRRGPREKVFVWGSRAHAPCC